MVVPFVRKIAGRILRSLMPDLLLLDEYRDRSRQVLDSAVDDRARLFPPYFLHKSSVGRYSYLSKNASVSCTEIGSFCSIGPNFISGWGIHPLNGLSTSPMFYSTEKQNGFSLAAENKIEERKMIRIGNDVFIGMNVMVLDGVTIGNGAVIGAGTVVSKDVAPYTIVAGNPMRVLRKRFDDETIRHLSAIEWWNWSDERLKEVEQHFFSPEDFIRNQT